MNTTDKFTAFCGIPDFNSYFVLVNTTVDMNKLHAAICGGINFEMVIDELSSLSGNISLVHNMVGGNYLHNPV